MRTVTKAFSLLMQFSDAAEPRSLGAIANEAGLDKATTRRMLVAMKESGFIDQDPKTREYSLGTAILPLARACEAMRPIQAIAEMTTSNVAEYTGETAHFSVPTANGLSVLRVAQSPQPVRVHIAEGDILPFHSSGSGIAYLSASETDAIDRVLGEELPRFASNSYTTQDRVLAAIEEAKLSGYAMTRQTFGDNTCGIGVPVFHPDHRVIGALAVATPLERMNEQAKERTVACLISASQKITAMI